MNRTFIISLLVLSLTSTASFTNAQTNYGINFTGSNYVDAGSNAALNATNIKTMECWVKFSSLSTTDMEIMSRSIASSGIELVWYGSNLCFYAMNATNSTTAYITYTGTNLATGVWYHLAVAWDGTNSSSMRLYVNGISVGTLTGTVTTGVSNPTGTFRIGNWSYSTARYLNGVVDQARVWSIQRTQAQIKAGMYGSVATTTTGLIADYLMDEGTGTTTANATSTTGLNGTLTGSPTWVASPVQFQNGALSFNGSNSNVQTPAKTAYNITTGTVEFWAMPTTFLTAAPEMCMVGVRGSTSSNYSFHMASAHVGLWNTSAYSTVPYTFSLNTWYHLAFVCNGTSTTVYINGVAQSSTLGAFGNYSGNPLVMGYGLNSSSFQEPYAGALDEVRIWSTQRTATDIQNNMYSTLTGTETGLVALYRFDQGIAAGANAGLITAIDNTTTSNNATLANFALTGSASNYIAHTITPLPVVFTTFTGARSGNTGVLTWETAQEQNSKEFIVQRSSDGVSYSDIGTVSAAGNSSLPTGYSFIDHAPAAGSNVYRIREADLDGKFMYSSLVTLNFSAADHSGIRIYPNPARQTLNYVVTSATSSRSQAQVTDLSGRIVSSSPVQLSSGINSLSLKIGNLLPGVYVLRVVPQSGEPYSSRFQVIR